MQNANVRTNSVTVSSGSTLSGKAVPADAVVTVLNGGTITEITTRGHDTLTVSAGGVASTVSLLSSTLYNSGAATSIVVGASSFLEDLGGSSTAAEVLAGGTETVASLSVGSLIEGGTQIVSAFGTARAATVSAGLQAVIAGTAEGTTVLAGGEQFVASAAAEPRATGTVVSAGGVAASEGGALSGIMVEAGGQAVIAAPAALSGTIAAGGTLVVTPAGFGSANLAGAVVQAGGTLVAVGGAAWANATIDAGATVTSAAIDVISAIANGDLGFVEAVGTSVTATTLGANEQMTVYAGGLATDTDVAAGQQAIESGGIAAAATIALGGAQYVYQGGLASGSVLAGGLQYLSFGMAQDAAIGAGGDQIVAQGGTASLTTIGAGGQQMVETGGTAVSSFVLSGGTETVDRLGSASDTVVSAGGMLVLSGGVATLVALTPGAVVDFTTLAFTAGASASINGADQLVVHDGGKTAMLQLQGAYGGDTETFSADAKGRLDMTLVAGTGAALHHDLAPPAAAGLPAATLSTLHDPAGASASMLPAVAPPADLPAFTTR